MATKLRSLRACPTGEQADRESAAASHREPRTLQDVVERALRLRAASGRALSRMAAVHGHQLSYTTVNKIRQGQHAARPADENLRALAFLAAMDEEAVFRIAGKDPAAPATEREMTGLRGIVERACELHGASGRQLALMAQRKGFTIAPATVNRIRSGAYHSTPGEETIRAFAWLAGVSEATVYRALSAHLETAPAADDYMPELDGLPEGARRVAMEYLRLPMAS